MARSIKAPVKPELLVWARQTAGYPAALAAQRVGVAVERLKAWEQGAESPSLAQLRKLADTYERPLAAFFLPHAPPREDVTRLFRRGPGAPPPSFSPALTLQLRQALERREVVLELAESSGGAALRFSPRARLGEEPAQVVHRVRELLGIRMDQQLRWRDEHEALDGWRGALEALGILVFQVPGIPVGEMRGMSVFYEDYPLILLNFECTPESRVFTLMHGLVHLLLQQGYIDTDEDTAAEGVGNDVESFYNAVAGALLVPQEPLLRELKDLGSSQSGPPRAETLRLSERFKVSEEVVLRRLVALGRMSQQAYRERRQALQPTAKRKAGRDWPIDALAVAQLGMPFIRGVLDAYHHERLTLSEVSGCLGVKVEHLPKVEQRVLVGDAGAADAACATVLGHLPSRATLWDDGSYLEKEST